jgi:hypothetical protein
MVHHGLTDMWAASGSRNQTWGQVPRGVRHEPRRKPAQSRRRVSACTGAGIALNMAMTSGTLGGP